MKKIVIQLKEIPGKLKKIIIKLKEVIISDQFRGYIIFLTINVLIKILEIKIATIYDFEIAILLMFFSSLILKYFIILIYDYLKKDWLLIEYLKEKLEIKEEVVEQTFITKKILKFKKIGGDRFLIACWVCLDPIVTVLLSRDEHHSWNNIPNIKTGILYISSTIFCTITVAILIYSFWGLIKLIF